MTLQSFLSELNLPVVLDYAGVRKVLNWQMRQHYRFVRSWEDCQ